MGGGSEAKIEAAGAIVFHEEQLKVLGDSEITITIVIEVDDQCTGTVVEPAGSALAGVISKGSIRILDEKAVG